MMTFSKTSAAQTGEKIYYSNDFEERLGLEFWTSEKPIQTHELALSSEQKVSGRRSAKIDFTALKSGHYIYFKAPIDVVWQAGESYVLSGNVRVEAPPDVQVSLGISRSAVYGKEHSQGNYAVTEVVEKRGEWSALASNDLGQETFENAAVSGLSPQAKTSFDAIYLSVIGAREGDRITIFVDDLAFRSATMQDRARWRQEREGARLPFTPRAYPAIEDQFQWGVNGSLESNGMILDLPLKVTALLTARDWKNDFIDVNFRLGGLLMTSSAPSDDEKLKALLDANERHDFKMSASVFLTGYYEPRLPREQSKQALERVIPKFKDHPALLAWNIIDEPRPDLPALRDHWLWGKNKIEAMDSKHPILAFLNTPPTVRYYSPYTDVALIDWYPVRGIASPGIGHPMSTRAMIRLAWENGARHVWFAPQAYGDANRRVPTAAELRLMTYLPLAQGTTGLIYYHYQYRPLWHPWGGERNIVDLVFARPTEMGREVHKLSRIIPLIAPVLVDTRWDKNAELKVVAAPLPHYGIPAIAAELNRGKNYDVLVACNLDVDQARAGKLALTGVLPKGRRIYDLHTQKPALLDNDELLALDLQAGDGRFYLLADEATAQEIFAQIHRRHFQKLSRLYRAELEESVAVGVKTFAAQQLFAQADTEKDPLRAVTLTENARQELEKTLAADEEYSQCRARLDRLQSNISAASWKFGDHALLFENKAERRAKLEGPLKPQVDALLAMGRAYHLLRYGQMTGQVEECLRALPVVEAFAQDAQEILANPEQTPAPVGAALAAKIALLKKATFSLEGEE